MNNAKLAEVEQVRLIDADAIKAKYPDRRSLNQVLNEAPTACAMESIIKELEAEASEEDAIEAHDYMERGRIKGIRYALYVICKHTKGV